MFPELAKVEALVEGWGRCQFLFCTRVKPLSEAAVVVAEGTAAAGEEMEAAGGEMAATGREAAAARREVAAARVDAEIRVLWVTEE